MAARVTFTWMSYRSFLDETRSPKALLACSSNDSITSLVSFFAHFAHPSLSFFLLFVAVIPCLAVTAHGTTLSAVNGVTFLRPCLKHTLASAVLLVLTLLQDATASDQFFLLLL